MNGGGAKKLLVLTTGGTIASVQGDDGLSPALGAMELGKAVPRLPLKYDFDCKAILNIDSANMQPEEWKIIARAVYENYGSYTGFVITHGTDTMAYTASMLSFMLRGLGKPVVMTGSQLPIGQPYSDAEKNIADAFLVAASDIPGGVYIVFNGEIILGCRASKVRTTSFNAFESINRNYVGYVVNGGVMLTDPRAAPADAGGVVLDDAIDPDVFLLKLIPGTRPDFFDHFVRMGYKGLVIEAFGSGNMHFLRRDLPQKINALAERGVSVVITSQCTYETADTSIYEAGRKVDAASIISGFDMTTEAAVTKLMWVLGHETGRGRIRGMMLSDVCGEVRPGR